VLFTVAMGLYFLLTDRGLEEHYPRRFTAGGRFALAAVLLGGWAAEVLVAPTSTMLVALLTARRVRPAHVFKEEIPSDRRSFSLPQSYWRWFSGPAEVAVRARWADGPRQLTPPERD
jgi:hypothetical protein